MKRFAFTMLELVFVIIVIGILAVLAMPSFNRNPLAEAAEQVAGHIRYTQHLAMIDDKFDPTDATWWKERWQIRFADTLGVYYYEVFSDKNQLNGSNVDEEAIDPLTHLNLGSGNTMNTPTDAVNLTDNYGIDEIGGTCAGGNRPIAFDNLGRPYAYNSYTTSTNPFDNLLVNSCTIILKHKTDGNATITVHPETGYVSITY
jgi:Tfp pilus assembly protein FimT